VALLLTARDAHAKPDMPRLLIRNIDWVVTVDRDRRLIADGAIAIVDDRIEAVGKSSEIESRFSADEVIDGRSRIAFPGFVDCTVATVQQLGRGLGDRCDAPVYRLERTLSYESALTSEDALCASRASQLEMMRAGTTTFVDSGSRFPAEVAAAAAASGLRALVPRACADVFDTFLGSFPDTAARESLGETIEQARRAIESVRQVGSGRVRPAVALPWLAACSDELLRAVAVLAREANVAAVASAGMSRDDAVASRREHGCTEIARLHAAGLVGPNTIISHASFASPRDMAVLAERCANVVCCPSMSHRLGTGALEFGRYPELLEFGANVTLGSGSPMASNFSDIVRQIFLYCGGNKSLRLDATIASPESALEMATIRGAATLGLAHDIGSLEAGKKADIAMFRAVATDWIPLINPLANLTFSTRGGADTVIVDGKVLLAGGHVRAFDEGRILQECQTRAEAIAARSGLARFGRPMWTILAASPKQIR
jgi:5-methylthioadenosine/S-adenosylhomocysteine deaminase